VTWLTAFVLLFVLDFTWAFYVKKVQDDNALAASGWASILLVVAGLAQIGYVNDPWLLIPSMAGAFAGTYAGVVYSKRKVVSATTGPL
jgi:hypothetical protein